MKVSIATAVTGAALALGYYLGLQKSASTANEDPSAAIVAKIDAIFGAHMEAELESDLDRTMSTMSSSSDGTKPHLVNIPTMVGGRGYEGVKTFYQRRLIGQFFPPDVQFETVSRTYSLHGDRVVDELIISFTHTNKIDWMLPGIAPTHKFVQVAFVVIVGIDGDKVSYEHIHWDQASVLVQLGLLNNQTLPVTGKGAVDKLRNPSVSDPFFQES